MKQILLSLIVVMALSACSEIELGSHLAKQVPFPSDAEDRVGDFKVGNPYKVKGQTYYPSEKYRHSETGVASWYGPGFHGKLTANGEVFNKYELTAAHKTLQMPSMVRVTNLDNGRSIIVRVNDRGPFAHDRIIDLSEKAAEALRMKSKGTARVRVDVLEKESRMVASAAKKGLSTRGTELALNRGKALRGMDLDIATPVSKPGAPIVVPQQPDRVMVANHVASEEKLFSQVLVEQTQIPQYKPVQQVVIEQTSPTPQPRPSVDSYPQRVTSKPVTAPQQPIYVQTGAFTNEDNAMTMKMSLYNISEPVNIYRSLEKGVPIYKVKIGPVASIEKANELLTLLERQGRDANMIVAQN